jgi:hypothetical protein
MSEWRRKLKYKDNIFFENVRKLNSWKRIDCIQYRLYSEDICYLSIQDDLFPHMSKNVKIEINTTECFLLVSMDVKLGL